jgi:hypothetical protein
MNTTDPTWITEGAEVAIDGGGMFTNITFARIERMTATQIVLDNGRKFRREPDHRELGTNSSVRSHLIDPSSSYVVNAEARRLLADFSRHINRITSGSEATVGGMNAADVRATIDGLVDKLNMIRKDIDRRAGL